MKKFCSALLAGALALSLGVTAFAGSGGVIQPRTGDNTITFDNGGKSDPLAKLYFYGDSDPDDFYIKLSTDWDDCAYEDAFADQDAYLFSFTVNPSIPAASVPTLMLYNPYADEDDDIKPGRAYIYEVSEDGLRNVSSNFSAGTDSSDKAVFITRTRKPGVYIVAEKKPGGDLLVKSGSTVKKLPVEEDKAPSKSTLKPAAPSSGKTEKKAAAPSSDGRTGMVLPSYRGK